jgi:hypothetical protein
MRHVLYAYTVTVRKKRDDTRRPLGNFDEHGADLLKLFSDFLIASEGVEWNDALDPEDGENPQAPSTGSVAKCDGPFPIVDPLAAAGKFQAGVSGIRNDIYERSGITPAYRQQLTDIAYYPTLVYANLPGTATLGFFVFHQHGLHGIKTKMWTEFASYVKARYRDYIVELKGCFPEAWVQRLIQERPLPEVILTRFTRPSDVFSGSDAWTDELHIATVRTVIRATQRRSLKKTVLLDVLNSNKSKSSLLTFQNVEYDHASIVLYDESGKRHTISLDAVQMSRPGLDVSVDLKLGTDQHADMQSLYTLMVDFVEKLTA